ncbi:MAG: phosphatidate cytidylyltransferase [Deltaproteobacteria bacterium]|nr:phosphatidate cytidylyltransferase [Deltaproteobacteria bacterium]
MITRVLAALVGLAVVIPAILWGGQAAVLALAGLAVVVGADEYVRMATPDDRAGGLAVVGGGGLALFATLSLAPVAWHAPLGGLLLVAVFLNGVLRPGADLAEAAARVGKHALGLGWVGGFLAFLPLLRELGLGWVFLALVIPWLGDTGGYFSGRAFGKHKMYPKLSPKKTWEGLAGGLTLTVAGVFALRYLVLDVLSPVDAVVLGLVLGAMAALGDLAESLLKRAYGVKDSGRFMPGHGGLLDRIDSLLFVAPLLYAYAVLIKGL